jgi:hypothetical protein
MAQCTKASTIEAEFEYWVRMLRGAATQVKYANTADTIRQLALTRRKGVVIALKWMEADADSSCLRSEDGKEGEFIRRIGLPVVEYLERWRTVDVGYVFPGQGETSGNVICYR